MNQSNIGRLIAKKRKEKNLTQAQLAKNIGVSNKTISKWETGKCMPDYSVIQELCRELGLSLGTDGWRRAGREQHSFIR